MDLLIFITVSYRVKCINLSVLILKEEMILRGIKVFTFVLSTKKELDREINSIRRKPDCVLNIVIWPVSLRGYNYFQTSYIKNNFVY